MNLLQTNFLSGSLDCLKRHGASESDISVAWVPGAFEIPVTLKVMAESKNMMPLSALAQS